MGLSQAFASLDDKDKRAYMRSRAQLRKAVIDAQQRMASDDWSEEDDIVLDRLDKYLEDLSRRAGASKPPVSISAPRPAVNMTALEDALKQPGSNPN